MLSGADSSGRGASLPVSVVGIGVSVGGGGIEMAACIGEVGVKVGNGVRVGYKFSFCREPGRDGSEQARLVKTIRVRQRLHKRLCRYDCKVFTSSLKIGSAQFSMKQANGQISINSPI